MKVPMTMEPLRAPGLGRIVALHRRSSTPYQIYEQNR
jgi:hypothetical protein